MKNTIKTKDLEIQEQLTLDFIKQFKCEVDPIKDRPAYSFIELVNWVKFNFQHYLSDTENVNKLIHNRIIIDGEFLFYTKLKNISVTPLYKDSIISWNTDNNFEKFFVQGVFLIKSGNTEFIHCALYHKGNQNEDEVSFFILVSEKNYEEYLKLRNDFDQWCLNRQRSSSNIRVIGGEDIEYSDNYSWEDLFLPDDMKKELISLVETFLSSKSFYNKNNIPWKRGLLLHGKPGCGKTSIIKTIISNYDFKPVTVSPNAFNEIEDAFYYASKNSPALLYFEDLDSLLKKVDISLFLNLMDGISTHEGVFIIATANSLKELRSSIINRPSRFDKKFEIPLPTQDLSYNYLKKWFGNMVEDSVIKNVSKKASDYDFSYSHLKELYISSMYEVISNNKKKASSADISKTFNMLIKDIKSATNKISTDNLLTEKRTDIKF